MKKAAIYARFSTDLQNERSIEDQVALCRNYAAREGMNVKLSKHSIAFRATWRTSRVFTKGCRFSVSKFGQFMKVW